MYVLLVQITLYNIHTTTTKIERKKNMHVTKKFSNFLVALKKCNNFSFNSCTTCITPLCCVRL